MCYCRPTQHYCSLADTYVAGHGVAKREPLLRGSKSLQELKAILLRLALLTCTIIVSTFSGLNLSL